MALHCKTPPLRVEMVDRLSPIDQNLKPPQKVKQNSRKSHKSPPLARRRGAIGDNGSTLKVASDLDLRGQI